MYRLFLVTILLTGILGSCKSRKKDERKLEFKTQEIIFGRGGGFTGAYDVYFLSKDGKLRYKNSLNTDTVVLKTVTTTDLNRIFTSSDSLILTNKMYSEPGNMNDFIRIKLQDTEFLYEWSIEKEDVPDQIRRLNALLKVLSSE